jgi:hypothetical protein
MTIGRECPRALLHSVLHVESLCSVLSRLADVGENATGASSAGASHKDHDRKLARAWLLGRRQEVECFVGHVTEDFRSSRLAEASAVRAIDAYLTALHKGLAVHFGERFPSCCAASSSPVERVRRIVDGSTPPVLPNWPRRAERNDHRRRPDVPVEDLLSGLATRID